MACVYTYKGKDYSYAEFAAALHDGLLNELIADNVVSIDGIKYIAKVRPAEEGGEEPNVLFQKSISNSYDDIDDITREINSIGGDYIDLLISDAITEGVKADVGKLVSRPSNVYKPKVVRVSDFIGKPIMVTISDELTTGSKINPLTGRVIDNLNGGVGFNYTEGNTDYGWAYTDESTASDVLNAAKSIYNANPNMYPDGIVPVAVVKMGTEAINSNEAVFRVLLDNISSFPKKNLENAYSAFVEDIKSNIDRLNNIKSKKSLSPSERNALNGYIQIYEDYLKKNNNLLDVIRNVSELNINTRPLVIDRITSGKVGLLPDVNRLRADKPVTKALMEGQPKENIKRINLGWLVEPLRDESIKNVPQRHIIAFIGIDARANAPVRSNHPNYPFALKGVGLGIVEDTVHIASVLPTAYANSINKVNDSIKNGKKATPTQYVSRALPAGLSNAILRGKNLVEKVDDLSKLIGFLNLSFPNVVFFNDKNSFDDIINTDGVKKYVKDGEVIYGLTTEGNIYLNPSIATSNTAIHEMGHIWVDYIENNNQDLFNQGIKLIEGTKELNSAISSLGDNLSARKEALAILIGNRGETIVDASKRSKFKEWLVGMWSYLQNKFPSLRSLNAKQIGELNLEEFLGGALKDILSGQVISTELESKKPIKTILETDQEIQEYVDGIRDLKDKESRDKLAKRLRDKKIKGALSAVDFGLTTTIYNGALEFMASQVEKGTKLGNAIANTLKWIDERMSGSKWNKGAFAKYVNDTYTMRIGGVDVDVVRDDTKETADIINGFYSDIEQRVLNQKAGSKSATDWLGIVGKGDEATFTGIRAFLKGKDPNSMLSKQEILDYMKDNRVIVVVVQSEPTRYSVYQLEGEKENYKEVLVTLPNNTLPNKVPSMSIRDWYDNVWRKEENPNAPKFEELTDTEYDSVGEEWRNWKSKAEKSIKFKSTHFDEPNILVHLRMNTRTDATGAKVLFLEEIQSDWGQTGKKIGFLGSNIFSAKQKSDGSWDVYQNDNLLKNVFANNEKEAIKIAGYNPDFTGIATAPFVMDTNAWTKLGLKVALKEAVKQGADKIAWTTGEQQNERYDLSKQVDKIEITQRDVKGQKIDSYRAKLYKNGEIINDQDYISFKDLEPMFGKEIASKVSKGETIFEGENLKVGGKGMRDFYGDADNKGIVGRVAEAVFGQKIGEVKINYFNAEVAKSKLDDFIAKMKAKYNFPENGRYSVLIKRNGTEQEIKTYIDLQQDYQNAEKTKSELGKPSTQPSIDVTPELRSEIEKGLPLFGAIEKKPIKTIQDATQKREITEGREREYTPTQEGREATEAGYRYSPERGGEIQEQEETENVRRFKEETSMTMSVVDVAMDMADKGVQDATSLEQLEESGIIKKECE